MHFRSALCLLFVLLNCVRADNNKFMNSIRNMTNPNGNRTKQNEAADGLKRKIDKYLGECRRNGGESTERDYLGSSESSSSSIFDPRGFRKGVDGATYPAVYGARNYRSDNGNVDGYLTNYGQQQQNAAGCENRDNRRNSYGNDGYDQNENHQYQHNRYEPRGEQGYGRANRDFNQGFPRWKRNFNDRCISQCVFSYLELLDENRSPSESAFVQFLQENISNDRERIKAVRDARRCFAKFITTEEEDGCEFSRSLSKCLRLNID